MLRSDWSERVKPFVELLLGFGLMATVAIAMETADIPHEGVFKMCVIVVKVKRSVRCRLFNSL